MRQQCKALKMLHFDELLVRQAHKKELEKIKKLLTNDCTADILKKLSRLTTKQRTLITKQ